MLLEATGTSATRKTVRMCNPISINQIQVNLGLRIRFKELALSRGVGNILNLLGVNVLEVLVGVY